MESGTSWQLEVVGQRCSPDEQLRDTLTANPFRMPESDKLIMMIWKKRLEDISYFLRSHSARQSCEVHSLLLRE